ncbi:hypothetical protein M5689_013376 [Euphorbia peplus]|nr:hypothetical protein M5689_013376 [Euphorbia peplus]
MVVQGLEVHSNLIRQSAIERRFRENPMLEPFKNKEDWDWVKGRLVEVNGIDPATIPPGLMDSANYHFDGRIKPSEITMPIQAVECYRHLCALHYMKTPENIMNPIAIEGSWRIGQNGPKINYFPYMEDELWPEEDDSVTDFESDEDLEFGMNQLGIQNADDNQVWGIEAGGMNDEEVMALLQEQEVQMAEEVVPDLLIPKVEVQSPAPVISQDGEIQDWDAQPIEGAPFNADDYLVFPPYELPQFIPVFEQLGEAENMVLVSDSEEVEDMAIVSNSEESEDLILLSDSVMSENSEEYGYTETVSTSLELTEEEEDEEESVASSQGSCSGGELPPKRQKCE